MLSLIINVRARAAITVLSLTIAACLASSVSARADFGFREWDGAITASENGSAFTQAGGHPYEIDTNIEFNGHIDPITEGEGGDGSIKDIIVNVPPGLMANPRAITQCQTQQLQGEARRGGLASECPFSSQVGVIYLNLGLSEGREHIFSFSLYNMVPPAGVPARFGFNVVGVTVYLEGAARGEGANFHLGVDVKNISQALNLLGSRVVFWGTPADPSHDWQRCNILRSGLCAGSPEDFYEGDDAPHSAGVPPVPFLTMPTSCGGNGSDLRVDAMIDSWENPGVFLDSSFAVHEAPFFSETGAPGAQVRVTNCGILPFSPQITVQPTNHQADTPSGLNIEISTPQDGLLSEGGIAPAAVKDAVVTLPAGESVSPSAATGLGACSAVQIGLGSGKPPACPDSSKLGTVEIETPVLNDPLKGSIFLGEPECAPCNVDDDLSGRLVKLYIVAEGPGVVIKLPGRVEMDPVTGRIKTTFDDNPQTPFDTLKLNFKAGPRSPLVNPPACGSYSTDAVFTPWSGNQPVDVSSTFEVTSGPEGKPCPSSPQAFGPSFAAGTTNNQAGAFSPFSLTFARADGEQQLGGVSLKFPPGLLGTLSAVSLCPEPAASQGSCPASSEIGGLTVGAGAGANPFYVYGGKVFLTGPYEGGPFGLSVVVPAVAGPFNLGTVVVRGSIKLDPVTTALTITTDPLPTILDGIPLDLRTVSVNVANPGFIFNPTNCDPLALTGVLTGGSGGLENVSNSFQVTNCGRLGFAPKFTVSTPGKTSRVNGAGLTARIVYPKGAQANIAKVKVNLPKQLPSRLTTLQKACVDSVFNQNPANCPTASRIGFAKAITPVLPVPLEGPAYFVSHGGAAFPDLILALKGYGVSFNLIGTTFISKAGITSTSFKQVPDVPIDSFVLTLPQGPNSALAANGNLCASKLKMPSAFIAQDGTEIHQSTPITATGCTKHKAKKTSKHKKKK